MTFIFSPLAPKQAGGLFVALFIFIHVTKFLKRFFSFFPAKCVMRVRFSEYVHRLIPNILINIPIHRTHPTGGLPTIKKQKGRCDTVCITEGGSPNQININPNIV